MVVITQEEIILNILELVAVVHHKQQVIILDLNVLLVVVMEQ